MFSRIQGQTELLLKLEESLQKQNAESPLSLVEDLEAVLKPVTEVERVSAFRTLLDHQSPNLRMLGALGVYWHQPELDDEATRSLLQLCENSETRLHVLDLLKHCPGTPSEEFWPIVESEINSDDKCLQIAACALAQKYFSDGTSECRIIALRHLIDASRSPMPELKLMGLFGLLGSGVKTEETADQLLTIIDDLDESLQFAVVLNLSEPFSRCRSLMKHLLGWVKDTKRSPRLRGLTSRILGRICRRDVGVQRALAKVISKQSDAVAVQGAGLGLIAQDLAFPQSAIKALLSGLNSEDPEFVAICAATLREIGNELNEAQLREVASHVATVSDDYIREQLIRCFYKAPPVGLEIAMQELDGSLLLVKAQWCSVVSILCDKYPEAVMHCYEKARSNVLDEIMPLVLADCRHLSSRTLNAVRLALRSGSELERANALRALKSADSSSESASGELIHIYLNGESGESSDALEILLRWGEATFQSVREYNELDGSVQLAKFQHLQRLLGFSEKAVRFAELSNLCKQNDLLVFVATAGIFETTGPKGVKRLSEDLERLQADGKLPESLKVSEQSIRRTLMRLQKSLSFFSEDQEPIQLFTTEGKSPQELTELGRIWLQNCRSYLQTIGVDISGLPG